GAAEAFHLDTAALVITDSADIFNAKTEAGTGNQRAGDLAAGAERFVQDADLAGISRELGDGEEGIRGVKADTNDIEIRHRDAPRRRRAGRDRAVHRGSSRSARWRWRRRSAEAQSERRTRRRRKFWPYRPRRRRGGAPPRRRPESVRDCRGRWGRRFRAARW